METYLTVEEVAEILKVNKQSVFNWIDREGLPAVRVGTGRGRLRIRPSDLDRWVERGRIGGGDPTAADEVSEARSSKRWSGFETAVRESNQALATAAPEMLIRSLRSLAESAQALADELARSVG
jgi:excisionase family DNA binding protein